MSINAWLAENLARYSSTGARRLAIFGAVSAYLSIQGRIVLNT